MNETNEIQQNWIKIFVRKCLLQWHSVKNCRKLCKTVISRYSLLNIVYIFAQNILKMGDGWDSDFEHKIPLGFILFTVVACNFKVYDLKFTIVDYTSV